MKTYSMLSALCLAAPAAAQLPFDLVEITTVGNPDHPGVDFQRHPASFQTMESGPIASVDVNNDGWIDLFFSDTEGHPNHLYINNADGTFSERAAEFGISEVTKRRGSSVFFDMDNDGDLDLLSCGYPGQAVLNFDLYTLLRNNGAPDYHFTDVTQSTGGFELAFLAEPTILGDPGGVTTGDVDGDGFLDIFVTYVERISGTYILDAPRLWLSEPNPVAEVPGQLDYSPRVFRDRTAESGLNETTLGWTWTPTLYDYDRDGDLDLHIAMDGGMDVLRYNDGTGFFGPNMATPAGLNGAPAETRTEMGVAFGDVDFDGQQDIYTTNAHLADRFYMNRGSIQGGALVPFYEDVAPETDTDVCVFGWGCSFADMDLDQDLDLVVVAGMGVGLLNFYHENQWPSLEASGVAPNFVNRSAELPDFQQPGGQPDVARAMSSVDFDNDGDLDVIVGRYGEGTLVITGPKVKAGVFENTLATTNHYLELDLREANGSRNTVGARVYMRAGEEVQMRTVPGAGTSFHAQEPYRQHFGLGQEPIAAWICVRWTDGSQNVMLNVPGDQIVSIDRLLHDNSGDMNGDNAVNQADLDAFAFAIRRPVAYDSVYGWWPYQCLGDMNGNGHLDSDDLVLLTAKVNG